jgi:hypothetical protein
MAERGRFELPIPVKVWLISSQLHSTGLCHLSAAADTPSSLPTIVGLGNTGEALDAPVAFVDTRLYVELGVEFAGPAP